MSKADCAFLQDSTTDTLQQDRRAKRRYPLDLPVQYKIMKNYLVIGTGTGATLDLSSNGISFVGSEPLKVGCYVELSISWPVLLNQACPLKLVASGKVVRCDGRVIGVRMDRHEFRTQSTKAAQTQIASGFALGAPSIRSCSTVYRQ